jgi:hypothetical protein
VHHPYVRQSIDLIKDVQGSSDLLQSFTDEIETFKSQVCLIETSWWHGTE